MIRFTHYRRRPSRFFLAGLLFLMLLSLCAIPLVDIGKNGPVELEMWKVVR